VARDLSKLVDKTGKRKKGASFDYEIPDDHGGDLDYELAFQPPNDLGNGQRFVKRFGRDFRHVPKVGWFGWDGERWSHDDGEPLSFMRAHDVSRLIRRELDALRAKPPEKWSEDTLNMRCGWLAMLQNTAGQTGSVRAMLTAAQPYLLKPLDEMDGKEWLCPCPNGTLELSHECQFRDSRREDFMTRRLGVPFMPTAECPAFEQFISQIMPNRDMADFLQRILGYALCGSTREQVIFLFHGSGNNGKSTLMNVVREVFGDFAMVSPVSTFLAKIQTSGGEASPDIARLPGARLVTASEPPEGARLDEGKVKEMTGGEPMTARHLNQGFFTFKPVFKAILLMNNLPAIRGVDHGIWRRIRLVPFTVQIPDEKIDRDLERRLKLEGPGILNWILRGHEAYRHIGLAPPDAAIAVAEEYRADQDIVGEFLRECCQQTDLIDPATGHAYECGSKELRKVYKAWCEENGMEAMPSNRFGAKVIGRGIRRRRSHGNTLYAGLVIKASWAAKMV